MPDLMWVDNGERYVAAVEMTFDNFQVFIQSPEGWREMTTPIAGRKAAESWYAYRRPYDARPLVDAEMEEWLTVEVDKLLRVGGHGTDVHLVLGPREYDGVRGKAWIACDPGGQRVRVPLSQRTRDAGKATCPQCQKAVAS